MGTILFIHGLESGPQGSKVRAMRALGFDVAAEDMHMSMWRVRKRNSMVRCLLRSPEPVALTLVALGATLVGVSLFGLVGLLPVGVLALVTVMRWRRWVGEALRRSRARCVAVQRSALAAHRPDVVVGSSWGGAIAAELIAQGHWTGRTVLLAPAFRRVQLAIDPPCYPALLQALKAHAERAPLVVFHDPDDEVVPFRGSQELARGSAATLHPAPGAGHRLLPVLDLEAFQNALR